MTRLLVAFLSVAALLVIGSLLLVLSIARHATRTDSNETNDPS